MHASTLLVKKFRKLHILELIIIASFGAKVWAENSKCEMNLGGWAGRLTQEGLDEVRRRSALTLIPKGIKVHPSGLTRVAVYEISADRVNKKDLLFQLLVHQEISVQGAWRLSGRAEMRVARSLGRWSPSIPLKLARQTYEDVVAVDTRVDIYAGRAMALGVETPFTVHLRYVRKATDEANLLSWLESGSATVELGWNRLNARTPRFLRGSGL